MYFKECNCILYCITFSNFQEHVVSILLKAGRREPAGMARCIALSALGMFVYRELTNHTFHPKVVEAMNVLLLALRVDLLLTFGYNNN